MCRALVNSNSSIFSIMINTALKKKLLNELKKIWVNFSTKCNYIFPPKSNLFEMSQIL